MTTTSNITSPEAVAVLTPLIKAPYVNVSKSSISDKTFWICVTVSLEAKGTWASNIFENSPFARISVQISGNDFVAEAFSGGGRFTFSKPFRKTRASSLEQLAEKINAWVQFNLANPKQA